MHAPRSAPQPDKPAVDLGDAVTAYRREAKFVFRGGDERRLRDLLELRCTPIRFGARHESLVHSIYFDDASLSSCAESFAGIPRRTKLRLRWYDRPLPGASAFFEVKRRSGVIVRKLRTPIAHDRPLADLPYAELLAALDAALPPEHAAALALRHRPTALVSYRRRHYRDPISGMRLTIDANIRGYDQLGRHAPARRFGVEIPDLVVLEVKAGPGDEFSLGRLLPGMHARMTRSSKYVACCARMGWCALPDAHE